MENSDRYTLLQSLMKTTHRDIQKLYELHGQVYTQDPMFYKHLAFWSLANDGLRDQNLCFALTLLLGDTADRPYGAFLASQLSPRPLSRLVRFITGSPVKYFDRGAKNPDAFYGLGHKHPPRILRTEIINYLRSREADEKWFTDMALVHRSALKHLYARLHIKPGPFARKVLFESPPEGTVFAALAEATPYSREGDYQSVRAILEPFNVPYVVMTSLIPPTTPANLITLLMSMTPNQIMVNMPRLEKTGLLTNPEVSAFIKVRLASVTKKKDKRVAETSSRINQSAQKVQDADMRSAMYEVQEAYVAPTKLDRRVALLIDISSSMESAIAVAAELMPLVAIQFTDLPDVYAFNDVPRRVEFRANTLESCIEAISSLRCDGMTSIGSGFSLLARQVRNKATTPYDHIIVITDQDENSRPHVEGGFAEYVREVGMQLPAVTVLSLATAMTTTFSLRTYVEAAVLRVAPTVDANTIQLDSKADMYGLPQILPRLRTPRLVDFIMDIMDVPLQVPERFKEKVA